MFLDCRDCNMLLQLMLWLHVSSSQALFTVKHQEISLYHDTGFTPVSNPFYSDSCSNAQPCFYSPGFGVPANSTTLYFNTNSQSEVNGFAQCVALGTGNACWGLLKLDLWLRWQFNDHVCPPGIGLSKCILYNVKQSQSDCSGIRPGTCSAPAGSQTSSLSAHLIAYTLYAINQYLNSWYTAVQYAGSIVEAKVDKIVQLLDPPQDTTFGKYGELIEAFVGIASLVDPVVEVTDSLLSAALTLGDTVSTASNKDPIIGQTLNNANYPTGTTDSQLYQIADLRDGLSQIVETVLSNLEKTAEYVLGTFDGFLAFADQEKFSGDLPTLQSENSYLLYVFNTWIISKALVANDIHGVLALNTDPVALATNGTKLNYDLNASKTYDNLRTYDAWWYSDDLHSAFGLDAFSQMNRPLGDTIRELLEYYTTGPLLFESAYKCASQTSLTQTGNTDALNTTCPSQLKIHTWDMTCVDPILNSTCEFTDGTPRQHQFLDEAAKGSSLYSFDQSGLGYSVPNSYLGPLITQDKYKLKRT
ncbi:uncharacterized protein KY384_000051 [Bacidia gigantensis]|uniref:uncharacterized protein n=1 Tax=Bacidia gigantensis TaxID=2732470 RepID=UPI001D041E5B|nr:uncharacterized protein KY384_000051 [Bacidia gigantensis]KAG8526458.1 hypothetical protein KY384_000051 [Bacidia gigantensis]